MIKAFLRARGCLILHLLNEHIQKEDNVLFPMADNILADEESKLLKDFHRADDERGTGEKYTRVAEELAGWGA